MDIVSIRKQRLKEAIDECGSVSALAAKADVNEKYLRQILRGFQGKKDKHPRSVGDVLARKIEKALNKNHGWMDSLPPVARAPLGSAPPVGMLQDLEQESARSGSETLPSTSPQPISQWSDVVSVPILASAPDGANAMAAQGAVSGAMLLSRDWLLRNLPTITGAENLAAMPAANDAMAPTFTTGDVLLIDRGVDRVRADGVYAFVIGDELFIKRLQRQIDGGLTVISDNDRYPPQTIRQSEIDKLQVRGRVMCSWNLRRL